MDPVKEIKALFESSQYQPCSCCSSDEAYFELKNKVFEILDSPTWIWSEIKESKRHDPDAGYYYK